MGLPKPSMLISSFSSSLIAILSLFAMPSLHPRMVYLLLFLFLLIFFTCFCFNFLSSLLQLFLIFLYVNKISYFKFYFEYFELLICWIFYSEMEHKFPLISFYFKGACLFGESDKISVSLLYESLVWNMISVISIWSSYWQNLFS